MSYYKIKLNKKGVKVYLNSSLWFTKKDILEFEKISKEIFPGSLVKIYSPENFFLGVGYFNPNSWYCLKLLTKFETNIDEQFFYQKFFHLLKFKRSLYPGENCFRLVFSEGDFLPGLIVDVFERVVVVQIHTLGMENLRSFVISALIKLLSPKAIVLKNDSSKRKEEDLEIYSEVVYGKVEDLVLVKMDEIKFLIPVLKGQKTGFFLDQRENRRFIMKIARELEVIDGFSYIGGFGFYCLKGGAKRVFMIDRSSQALEIAEEIAKVNNWKDRVITIAGDIFQILKNSPKAQLIVLDPPAFIKSHKHLEEGERKYEVLYQLGLSALEKGYFFGFSCSYFLGMERLKKFIQKGLSRLNKQGSIIFHGFQAPDHTVNPTIEETLYLKGLGVYVW